ncbi:MAG: DNA mismatch repair endonuclease MutL [Gemmatimonadota bacterium]|jgi:DNA mismatch repair protein MutL|nr:DNA mismatch repair endonuclease MutL [Gemmatimonadota bacterium]
MPRRIHILSDQLANQIAAGEVVERPASVVKELMENALDAGATRITVSIRNGGKAEIRVADDGHGMGREDALLALDRHATSKISDPDDLVRVRTLGFRGEALPSIASVARLSLETAERDGDGTRILVNGGRIAGVESCARRTGTTVSARSIFFNTPARAKFLRSTAAETRAVTEVVTVLALAHPGVAFTLESNDRVTLELPSTTHLATRIADIWGPEETGELIPVVWAGPRSAVSGLVQRPHNATTGGRRSYLFVNGRSFSDRFLVRAVDRGYLTTIAPGVRPSFFLFLDVPDGDVDVNVHPSKAEVRFRYHAGVEEEIEHAVRTALQPLASAPGLTSSASTGDLSMTDGPSWRGWGESGIFGPGRTAGVSPAATSAEQMTLFVASAAGDATGHSPSANHADSALVAPVMWQVHNTYIFAETRDGLIIVDQHSAHERVLYEEISSRWGGPEATESQRLLFPITIRLTAAELDLVEQMRGLFAAIGFEIEEFGGRSIIVHAVPNPHPHFDAERCLREMIRELSEGSELISAARNQHQRLALTFACKAAIKAGQPLSQAEISELFDRLFATELPYHDIHGRPTVVQLPLAELHNRFRRSG